MVRPRTRRQGFSMMEMLIVLLVIGVLAGAIVPALTETVADNRAAAAAEELVRLHRHVRARVTETGLAHLVIFDPTANNGLGRVRVWEGMNNHCATTPWTNAIDNGTDGHFPVEELAMANYNPTNDGSAPRDDDPERQVITLSASQGVTQADGAGGTVATAAFSLCFQPNGMIYEGAGTAPWGFASQRRTVFTIHRSVTHAGVAIQHGRDRHVLYQPGGNARLMI